MKCESVVDNDTLKSSDIDLGFVETNAGNIKQNLNKK